MEWTIAGRERWACACTVVGGERRTDDRVVTDKGWKRRWR